MNTKTQLLSLITVNLSCSDILLLIDTPFNFNVPFSPSLFSLRIYFTSPVFLLVDFAYSFIFSQTPSRSSVRCVSERTYGTCCMSIFNNHGYDELIPCALTEVPIRHAPNKDAKLVRRINSVVRNQFITV